MAGPTPAGDRAHEDRGDVCYSEHHQSAEGGEDHPLRARRERAPPHLGPHSIAPVVAQLEQLMYGPGQRYKNRRQRQRQ
jgi:hypothetical protein